MPIIGNLSKNLYHSAQRVVDTHSGMAFTTSWVRGKKKGPRSRAVPSGPFTTPDSGERRRSHYSVKRLLVQTLRECLKVIFLCVKQRAKQNTQLQPTVVCVPKTCKRRFICRLIHRRDFSVLKGNFYQNPFEYRASLYSHDCIRG